MSLTTSPLSYSTYSYSYQHFQTQSSPTTTSTSFQMPYHVPSSSTTLLSQYDPTLSMVASMTNQWWSFFLNILSAQVWIGFSYHHMTDSTLDSVTYSLRWVRMAMVGRPTEVQMVASLSLGNILHMLPHWFSVLAPVLSCSLYCSWPWSISLVSRFVSSIQMGFPYPSGSSTLSPYQQSAYSWYHPVMAASD